MDSISRASLCARSCLLMGVRVAWIMFTVLTKPGQTSGRAGFRAGLVKARPSFLKPEPGPKPEILHIFKPEPGPKSSPKPESPARMLFSSTRTCKPGPKPESPARNTEKMKPEPGPNYLSGCKTKPEPGPGFSGRAQAGLPMPGFTCTSRSAARASSQDSLDALPLLQGMQHKEGLGVVPSSAMVTAGRAAVHADQEAAASAHQCWSRSRRRE